MSALTSLQWPVAAANEQQVCFIRHAEAEHNVPGANCAKVDSELTGPGELQCWRSQPAAARLLEGGVELVIVSPLVRAIQTALALFRNCKGDVRFLLAPLCGEFRRLDHVDRGTCKTDLLARFPQLQAWEGATELEEEWWPPSKEIKDAQRRERVVRFLELLRCRPEKKIVVVSHRAFLCSILGNRLENLTGSIVATSVLSYIAPSGKVRKTVPETKAKFGNDKVATKHMCFQEQKHNETACIRDSVEPEAEPETACSDVGSILSPEALALCRYLRFGDSRKSEADSYAKPETAGSDALSQLSSEACLSAKLDAKVDGVRVHAKGRCKGTADVATDDMFSAWCRKRMECKDVGDGTVGCNSSEETLNSSCLHNTPSRKGAGKGKNRSKPSLKSFAQRDNLYPDSQKVTHCKGEGKAQY